MKKEYVAPMMTSLRYMFNEEIAVNVDYGDSIVDASSLMPPTPEG